MLRLSERQESQVHASGLGVHSSNARLSLSGENVGITGVTLIDDS